MCKPFTIVLEERPKSKDVDIVRNGLARYNQTFASEYNHQHLTFFVRDEYNNVVGGLLGGTYWGWLYIETLWIDEGARGQGCGRALLSAAENEALKRNCRYVHLNTHSFQAVEFYERNGYQKAGELTNLPPGHSKYLLWKELSGDEAGGVDDGFE